MFNYEINNGILKRISADLNKSGYINDDGNESFTCDWGKYSVRVPDGVTEIGANVFAESCLCDDPMCAPAYVHSMVVPSSVKRIAGDAINIPKTVAYDGVVSAVPFTFITETQDNAIFAEIKDAEIRYSPLTHLEFRLLEHNEKLVGLRRLFELCERLEGAVGKNNIAFNNQRTAVDIRYENFKITSIIVDNSWIKYESEENHDKPDSYLYTAGDIKLVIDEINRLFRG